MAMSGSLSERTNILLIGRKCTREEEILTVSMANMIRKYMHPLYKLATRWEILYSGSMNGFSLKTMYGKSRAEGPCILVIKTTTGSIFGAYCSSQIKLSPKHFGDSTCFLWRWEVSNDKDELKVYLSTKKRESIYLFAEKDFLAIGCGDGRFGLWIDSNLEHGESSSIPVFNNEVLSENTKFTCNGIELWAPLI